MTMPHVEPSLRRQQYARRCWKVPRDIRLSTAYKNCFYLNTSRNLTFLFVMEYYYSEGYEKMIQIVPAEAIKVWHHRLSSGYNRLGRQERVDSKHRTKCVHCWPNRKIQLLWRTALIKNTLCLIPKSKHILTEALCAVRHTFGHS